MGSKKPRKACFNWDRANSLGSTEHDEQLFSATTIPELVDNHGRAKYRPIVRFVRDGRVWIRKDFQK